MKCARLHLQERTKTGRRARAAGAAGAAGAAEGKPRHYCQKRLVDPGHDEDPRWSDLFTRFHCEIPEDDTPNETSNKIPASHDDDDMFLTVQTLKFQGDEQQLKRPRTSFKYKTLTDGTKHRMFVKQVVHESEIIEDDRSSQLTCYYYDDFAKYIHNTERSQPSSTRSSILFVGKSSRTYKENKATQVDIKKNKRPLKSELTRENKNQQSCVAGKIESGRFDDVSGEPKIVFHKSGKRKSLTISRTQSPETVQVIRVEVICNSSSPAPSDREDRPAQLDLEPFDNINTNYGNKPHFSNKYILTQTIKTLDQRVSGGDKVTLLCKTFKLTDRRGRSNTNIKKTQKDK